jgi:RNA polymerase sigma factor (sigma-70 family)
VIPSGGEVSDGALLAVALRDPDAFVRFYDRYEAAVAGFFLARVVDPEVAADLTAEVFANVLAASGRYREHGPTAAGWIFTIARNTLGKSVRRGRVEDSARRRLGSGVVELSDDTLQRLESADGERWVAEVLAQLPQSERDAVRERVLEERPYQEIAADLRTSELVIRKRVSRGLSRLRDRVERPS